MELTIDEKNVSYTLKKLFAFMKVDMHDYQVIFMAKEFVSKYGADYSVKMLNDLIDAGMESQSKLV